MTRGIAPCEPNDARVIEEDLMISGDGAFSQSGRPGGEIEFGLEGTDARDREL